MRTIVTLGAILGVMFLTTAAAEAITYDGRITWSEWGAYYLESPHVDGDAICPWFDWDVYGYYDDDYVYMGCELNPATHPWGQEWAIGQQSPGIMGFTTPGGDDVMISMMWKPPQTGGTGGDGWQPGEGWDWNWWAGVWINASTSDAPLRFHPFYNGEIANYVGDDADPEWNSLNWFGGAYGFYSGYCSTAAYAWNSPFPGDCKASLAFTGPPGAADADMRCSFCDYQELEQNFGKSTAALGYDAKYRYGDFNGNGKVDFADYQILEQWAGEMGACEVKIPWSLIEYWTGEQLMGEPLDWYTLMWAGSWWMYSPGVNSSSATGIPYVGGGSAAPEPATIALLALGVGGLVAMRKRKHLLVLLAVVLVGGFAVSANAATVTLDITKDASKVYVWATVSDSCEGLSSFIIDITADPDITLSNSLNKSPKGYDPNWNEGEGAEFGFKLFRTNGAYGIGISAGQATVYGDDPDPLLDELVLQGVGISAGSNCDVSWTYPVLLATCDYTVTTPGYIYVNLGAGFFNVLQTVGSWSGPYNVEPASAVYGDKIWVPEPATVALLALGVGGLVAMRKRKHLLVLLAAALVGGLAVSVNAATVTLDIDATGGQWWVWAEVSGGSCGISSFLIALTTDAGVNLTSSKNKSPKGYDPDWNEGEGAEFGFKLFRSDGDWGCFGLEIQAGQATAYGDENDPLQDDLVLQGIGQTAGSRCGVSWDAKVLIASGTYSVTTLGYIYVNTPASHYFGLLNDMGGGSWYGPGNKVAVTSVTGDQVWVPEPATVGLMVVGVAGVIVTQRRTPKIKVRRNKQGD